MQQVGEGGAFDGDTAGLAGRRQGLLVEVLGLAEQRVDAMYVALEAEDFAAQVGRDIGELAQPVQGILETALQEGVVSQPVPGVGPELTWDVPQLLIVVSSGRVPPGHTQGVGPVQQQGPLESGWEVWVG